jgi:hypothetical protein
MINRIANNVHEIRFEKKLPLLIISDVHFDSLKCDRESLKRHLDEIKDNNGQVFIIGDLFDVMGCHKDPRSKPAEIDPQYIQRGRSYLDLVVEDCAEFLKPYKDNIGLITYGNHEVSILKYRDTDPLDRLVYILNTQEGSPVHKGAYSGFIMCKGRRTKSGSSLQFNIAYHHGKGGNAKRSKGILYSQLDAMEYPDAHMIVSGHDHNKIYDPSNVRRRLSASGKIYHDTVHWIKTGSYKFTANDFGWGVEKGFMPTRMGGWFVDIEFKRDQSGNSDDSYIDCEVKEAIPVRQPQGYV